MDLLIFIIIIVLVLGVTAAVWKGLRGPGQGMLKPGRGHQLPPHPGQPGFKVEPDAGFNIVSRTGGPPLPPTQPPNVTKIATGKNGLGDVTVTQNLTAICRLTGKRVTDCSCDRCSGIRKKRA